MQRTLKFVKYLPSFGWRPIVLTPRHPGYEYLDYSLVEEIPPEAKIYRTASIEPYPWATTAKKRFSSGTPTKGGTTTKKWYSRLVRSIFQAEWRIGRFVARNFVFVPDYHVGWIPFAVLSGIRIIRKEKIDVIYATGDPWSDFIVGFFLRCLTGKPLVLDMRDPWTLRAEGVSTSRIGKKAEDFWESRCISAASKVINVTEGAAQAYIEKYPFIDKTRFVCITNGYDQPDFDGMASRKTARFTISSTGAFNRRAPAPFFEGLAHLFEGEESLRDKVRVKHMGTGSRVVSTLAREHQLEDMLDVIPYAEHRTSIQLLMDSDVLLVVLDMSVAEQDVRLLPLPAKLFEYLAARRPILAIVPSQSAVAGIVSSTESGVVVDPEDIPGIASAVRELRRQYGEGTLGIHAASDIRRFERKELTRRLAQLLDKATAQDRE
ncbi:MAG: glycosyltransferase [Chloroflexi bacterium]|nr:glycosyltransferase [Chloroflexota bacterium]